MVSGRYGLKTEAKLRLMEMRLSSVDDFEAHRFEAEQRAKTRPKEKLVISSGSNCDYCS